MFGDEFPEAFSTGDDRAGRRRASILGLPTEMLQVICAFLSKSDLKRLRLASSELAERVELRIDRVFVSPNRANLTCFDMVLGHPRYRLQVEEVVWDDSQLEAFPSLQSFDCAIRTQEAIERWNIHGHIDQFLCRELYYEDEDPNYFRSPELEPEDLFLPNGYLTDHAKTLLLRFDNKASRDIIARNETEMMSMEDSYTLYQKLYQDEQEIMKRGLDVKALHHGLAGFPNLKRITLTTDVWKSKYSPPSYETPFFRALPSSFRKPTVWPWLPGRPDGNKEWYAHRKHTMNQPVEHRLPFEWRAYSVIMASLVAVPHPSIEAVIIETGYGGAGISHQLFAAPNKEYDTTIEACQLLNLTKFKLVINSYSTGVLGNPYLDSGLLKDLFSSMRYLEHLDFQPNSDNRRGILDPDNVFSEATLHRLKHFALRDTLMTEEGLYELIIKLRNTESITLDRLEIVQGTYYNLLHRLQEYFAGTACRPRFTIINDCDLAATFGVKGSCLCDKDVDNFLYDNGACPFTEDEGFYTKNGSRWLTNDNDWNPNGWEKYDHKYADVILSLGPRNHIRPGTAIIDRYYSSGSP